MFYIRFPGKPSFVRQFFSKENEVMGHVSVGSRVKQAGQNQCKGPEAGECWVCLRKDSKAGAEMKPEWEDHGSVQRPQ